MENEKYGNQSSPKNKTMNGGRKGNNNTRYLYYNDNFLKYEVLKHHNQTSTPGSKESLKINFDRRLLQQKKGRRNGKSDRKLLTELNQPVLKIFLWIKEMESFQWDGDIPNDSIQGLSRRRRQNMDRNMKKKIKIIGHFQLVEPLKV